MNARSKGEKELYRTKFGQHFFGDSEFWGGKSKFTLEPLREGRRGFPPVDCPTECGLGCPAKS